MAHQFNQHRNHKVERSRVDTLTKGYASGGGVKHSDEPADKRLVRKMVKSTALKLHGGAVGQRSDKRNRAAGGMVPTATKKSKGANVTVNVISGAGQDKPAMPPIVPPPMMPPKPPMAPPSAAVPPPGMGGPGLPPPPAPVMRADGGKVEKAGAQRRLAEQNVPLPPRDPRKLSPDAKGQINVGSGVGYNKGGKIKRADGGSVSDASQGKTPVQPQNTKEAELKSTGRGKVITA